ncbi:PREDICTED: 39S ribosomal protein L52, mitochondrial [Nicrophorus vespilloides]|uniref:Large ribosomal subunit protein mL52 n=1 Tax=Nicrophorus vespilloides TaxID=110193 RepID=A0ABM1N6V9_NICVS|nr:PREDICTED: 39S ribosomal protein L52, mitochondrial [Nicrophorus vespilloides]
MNTNIITTVTTGILKCQSRYLSISAVRPLIQKWRQDRGLPLNPNAYGVLTDKADYTYLDGRPTPYGSHQKKRILKQRELAEKIITLSKEIDFAKENHQQRLKAEQAARQAILDSKLKPKSGIKVR